jgi:hypothetical protein
MYVDIYFFDICDLKCWNETQCEVIWGRCISVGVYSASSNVGERTCGEQDSGIRLESHGRTKKSLRINGYQPEVRTQFLPKASHVRRIAACCVRKARCRSRALTSRGGCIRNATPPMSSWPPYIGDVNPANDAAATPNYPASCCELAFLGGWWSQMLWMGVSFPLL